MPFNRLSALRDRLLGSARFQHWASRFPVTRPLARRRAGALFDLCAGFVYSQILTACVELEVFERLAGQPRTAADLASELHLTEAATRRLLRAAVALDLLEQRTGDTYGLGPLGAALRANPGIPAMVRHHRRLYRDLADPVALLRSPGGATELSAYWDYAGDRRDRKDAEDADKAGETAATTRYSDLMAASQAMLSAQIMDAYPFGRHRRLLDIGGGDGSFLRAVARRHPALQLALMDRPGVIDLARTRFETAGMSSRVQLIAADFHHDPPPDGFDLISLVRVLHDHDDAQVVALLRRIRRGMTTDGTLLIAEPMAATPGAEAAGDAYFGFYLLAMGQGRPRRPDELTEMLHSAGFSRPRLRPSPIPMLVRILSARPASGTSEKA